MIGYRSIELAAPCRVFLARGPTRAVDAVCGITITRVRDDEGDVFLVAGPGIVPGCEIAAHNVAAGVRELPLERAALAAANEPDAAVLRCALRRLE